MTYVAKIRNSETTITLFQRTSILTLTIGLLCLYFRSNTFPKGIDRKDSLFRMRSSSPPIDRRNEIDRQDSNSKKSLVNDSECVLVRSQNHKLILAKQSIVKNNEAPPKKKFRRFKPSLTSLPLKEVCWKSTLTLLPNFDLRGDLLSLPKTVCHLDLSGCHQLTLDDIQTLCEFLQTSHIKTLNLSDTGFISPTTFKCIATMLSKNSTLTSLNLSKNKISWEQSYPLYTGCERNTTLQELILNTSDSCGHLDTISLVVMLSLWTGVFHTHKSSLQVLSLGNVPSGFLSPSLVSRWSHICKEQEQLVHLGCQNIESCPSVNYWLDLNRYRARQLTRNGDIHECVNTLLNIVTDPCYDPPDDKDEKRTLNTIYYLIRNNPQVIQ